jgi:hypothetical protein
VVLRYGVILLYIFAASLRIRWAARALKASQPEETCSGGSSLNALRAPALNRVRLLHLGQEVSAALG